MKRVKLRIAYDGTAYCGWQKTGAQPSIQGALEQAIGQISRQTVQIVGASRTDTGVHAEGQIAHADLVWSQPLDQLQRGCNALLPPDIRVLQVELVLPTFHATLDAQAKEYRYWIETAPVCDPHTARTHWHLPGPLDLPAMRQAAEQLIGERDFATFCNARSLWKKGTERHLQACAIEIQGSRLCIAVTGNQFLYKMVRNLVGTMVYIGRGKIDLEQLPQILASGHRPQAGITAPAHGLILHHIYYLNTFSRSRSLSGA
jgi:tRNA pseudouridine38-40 synthase